jgi:hypothetical protein
MAIAKVGQLHGGYTGVQGQSFLETSTSAFASMKEALEPARKL